MQDTSTLAATTQTALSIRALQQQVKQQAEQAAKPTGRLAELLTLSGHLRTAVEQPVTFRPALFWQDDEPVVWPRTVNLIQGQTGVHKSRVAEVFGSAMLAPGSTLGNLLGVEFRPDESEAYRLLYIDTERNTSDQLPFAIQNLKARAGYGLAQHPENLDYTSLVMLPRQERFPALSEYLAHHRASFGGHLIVILDVLSDCVSDYNDVSASLGLMDLLNVAVNEHNATFLAVIHENPGSTAKARGHLGTEASNKASTVLQVGFVKEGGKPTPLIQLQYLKRRYAAPGLAYYATFDDATKSLVRAAIDAADVQAMARPVGAPRKVSVTAVLALLPELLADGPMQAGKLVEALTARLSIGDRTVRTYLDELLVSGAAYMEDVHGHVCHLAKIKADSGPSKLYTLTPIPQSP